MEVCYVGHGEEEVVEGQDPHLVEHDVAALLDVLHDEDAGLGGPEGQPAEPRAARARVGGLPGVVVTGGEMIMIWGKGQGQCC